jgi:putative transposase
LAGVVGIRVGDLIQEVCGVHDAHIIRGRVSRDHVHLFVSIPPQVTISRLVQRLKGKTADKLLQEFLHLRKQFWGRHFWARGYFCCSSGQVTDAVVAEYIEDQSRGGETEFGIDGLE